MPKAACVFSISPPEKLEQKLRLEATATRECREWLDLCVADRL
jgi:hypothetical protein